MPARPLNLRGAAVVLQCCSEFRLFAAYRGADVFATQGDFGQARRRQQALRLRDRVGRLQHPLQQARHGRLAYE
ncbi:hypothetical protein ISN35_03455 [Xanthomonas translucens pv. undulosa]|uniref:hypothetical protein n=1 Tax=Xanthomonas campestris pv. translucens TaxID=343 RepID=UPI00114D207A|nr:hypothetical protein [Xanthomonas translucens]QSQ42439.1 hypothetical protein ISN33_04365 [Xanthomonas translucens pv. translucens]QSQ49713.1 hypothetical protein ISN35_03455 [Xanthomonas translucens pv. undulosa]UJB14783.1 hypothetical protein LTC53_17870 [Xanthomonas translucens pv. undulosa]UPU49883.1 hypothetical protein MZO50_05465 [Xanthomonas translucens pv. undulosa]WLA00677.1 hypothetical protein MO330_18055 [Xanthomonas translucens]